MMIRGCLLVLSCVICFTTIAAQTRSVRERVSFNESWRFQKGDPEGTGDKLSYEKIKDWVRATGNEFVRDGVKRVKPGTSVGTDVAYTSEAFDDARWRQLNLPHDFGIEGPFNQEYPGETGKLPWFGVAWYRKHFKVAPLIRTSVSTCKSTVLWPIPLFG